VILRTIAAFKPFRARHNGPGLPRLFVSDLCILLLSSAREFANKSAALGLAGRIHRRNVREDVEFAHARKAFSLKATGIFQTFEKEYFRKDGSRVPVLLGGALFEGSGKEGVAFVLDLSEQKQQESARLYSEERYRIVVETASDAVVSIDDKGSIVFANPATATIFGYEPAELAGKPLSHPNA